jgi:hypothetical protein
MLWVPDGDVATPASVLAAATGGTEPRSGAAALNMGEADKGTSRGVAREVRPRAARIEAVAGDGAAAGLIPEKIRWLTLAMERMNRAEDILGGVSCLRLSLSSRVALETTPFTFDASLAI